MADGSFATERGAPLWMGVTPVTNAEYEPFVRASGNEPGWWTDGRWNGAEQPVVGVTWFDAVDYCNFLSEQAGLRPCYVRDGDEVTWQAMADGYRLPTEAEWEYACRAGTQTRWSFGDDEALLDEHTWFEDDSGGVSQPIGRKRANPWGLHDMHGNVWEWCWDWYKASYQGMATVDPRGPAQQEL